MAAVSFDRNSLAPDMATQDHGRTSALFDCEEVSERTVYFIETILGMITNHVMPFFGIAYYRTSMFLAADDCQVLTLFTQKDIRVYMNN